MAIKTIEVKFETQYHLDQFNKTLNSKVDLQTKFLHYPSLEIESKKPTKTKKKVNGFNWSDFWLDMPHFTKETGYLHTIKIKFDEELTEELEQKFGHSLPSGKIKSFWSGNDHHHRYKGKVFKSEEDFTNQYPIYIPSKGRWDCCKTADSLLELGVELFWIIIEEQEFDKYAEVYDKKHLLVLPKSYQETYETLDDLGLSKSTGPGPARNFAWDHSVGEGFEWHWVMDDNASGFVRFAPGNWRIPVKTPQFLHASEEFITRFKNVGMGSLNYRFFCVSDRPGFIVNTRMYSFILIRNDIPFRWRGRYNEDTIISIDVMEAGWKTVMLNQFLANKAATQTVKGGNNADFYQKEGTTNKSQMLKDAYPQFVELTERWGRPHHFVDYKKHWPERDLQYELWFKYDKYDRINEYGYYLTEDNLCLI